MFGILVFVAALYFTTIVFCYIFKKQFGIMFPPAIFSSALFIYAITCFAKNIKLSVFIYLFLTLVFLLVLVVLIKPTNIIKFFQENCLQGSIALFICCIFCLFIAYKLAPNFYSWDEFSHWGPMLKSLYYDNYFYITEQSIVAVHPEYPPIVSLFEIIPCLIDNVFSLNRCKFALLLLELSVFFPLISEPFDDEKHLIILFKNILKMFIVFAILTLFVNSIYGSANLTTVYQDAVLGFIAGYVLFACIKFDDRSSCFICCTALAFVILIKQSALVFAFVVLLSILIRCIVKTKDKGFKLSVKIWKKAFWILLSFSIAYFSWKVIYTFSYAGINTSPQFQPGLSSIISVINDDGFTQSIFVLKKFCKALIFENFYGFLPISVSLLLFFVLMGTCILFIKKENLKHSNVKYIVFVMILSCILYIAMMAYTYMFQFTGSESLNLASFERYMATLMIAWIVVAILAANYFIRLNITTSWLCVKNISIALLLLILCFPKTLYSWKGSVDIDSYSANTADEIRALNIESYSNVLLIDSNINDGLLTWKTSFNADKYHMSYIWNNGKNVEGKFLRFGELKDHKTINGEINIDSFVMSALVKNENYIYTKTVPDNVKTLVKDMYGVTLQDFSFYGVSKDACDNIKIKLIN